MIDESHIDKLFAEDTRNIHLKVVYINESSSWLSK